MKKHTYEYVKNYIESFDYTLLSDTYSNSNEKLLLRCPEGHNYNASFSSFKNNKRCPTCKGGVKLSYEYIKQFIENEEGYTLLSTTYKNNSSKLLIKCDDGHEYNTPFNYFQNGCRCPICAGNKKHSYEYVKQFVEDEGYTLLSTTYINTRNSINVRCPEGHEYKVKFYSFKQGHRCFKCTVKFTYDYVKSSINSIGYTLLSTGYEGCLYPIDIKCDNGHIYKTKFSYFKQGNRCPICFNESTSSKAESDLQLYIESLGIVIVRNDRTLIVNPLTGCNLELDIWIPSMKKAIEYNGLYWHSNINQQSKDKIKQEQCKSLGINLLIVDEFNWTNYKDIEMKRIEKWIQCL